MSVSRARGDKKKCDDLVRKIVHARGRCEACGSTRNPNAAHIVGRTSAWTRTDEHNLLLLCATCHERFHRWPDEWMAFLDKHIGRAEYDRLKRKAEDGVRRRFDWAAELVRLKALVVTLPEAA